MNIIVVGCGKVGIAAIASLIREGHDVTAIDQNRAVLDDVCNIYDVIGVCGNGADCETLTEAGVEKAELIVAATGSDELNMLACFLAKRMGARHSVARIRNPEYNEHNLGFIKHEMNLSMTVNPELLAAEELAKILEFPSAANVESFSRRSFELVQWILRPQSVLNGISLKEMRKKYPGDYLVCFCERENTATIPGGSFVLKSGDKIGIIATRQEIAKLFRQLGTMQKKAHRVMILGGGRISYYLAKILLGAGNDVKIIEADRERCKLLAEALPGAAVICGDGAREELLLEEGLEQTDAFVSLTGIDEENILLSYFASTKGVEKVIAKVNRSEFITLAEKQMGLECVVSPKLFVTDLLCRYARALENSMGSKIETLYKLMNGEVEAAEFKVDASFERRDVPIRDLSLRPNTLIAGIIRGRRALIPGGADCITAGDRVIVLTGSEGISDLADVLE